MWNRATPSACALTRMARNLGFGALQFMRVEPELARTYALSGVCCRGAVVSLDKQLEFVAPFATEPLADGLPYCTRPCAEAGLQTALLNLLLRCLAEEPGAIPALREFESFCRELPSDCVGSSFEQATALRRCFEVACFPQQLSRARDLLAAQRRYYYVLLPSESAGAANWVLLDCVNPCAFRLPEPGHGAACWPLDAVRSFAAAAKSASAGALTFYLAADAAAEPWQHALDAARCELVELLRAMKRDAAAAGSGAPTAKVRVLAKKKQEISELLRLQARHAETARELSVCARLNADAIFSILKSAISVLRDKSSRDTKTSN